MVHETPRRSTRHRSWRAAVPGRRLCSGAGGAGAGDALCHQRGLDAGGSAVGYGDNRDIRADDAPMADGGPEPPPAAATSGRCDGGACNVTLPDGRRQVGIGREPAATVPMHSLAAAAAPHRRRRLRRRRRRRPAAGRAAAAVHAAAAPDAAARRDRLQRPALPERVPSPPSSPAPFLALRVPCACGNSAACCGAAVDAVYEQGLPRCD